MTQRQRFWHQAQTHLWRYLNSNQGVGGGFCTAMVLLASVAIVSYGSLQRLKNNQDLVQHTYQVLATLERLERGLQDVENGRRGYILADNPLFLQTHTNGVQTVHNSFNQVRQLTRDNSLQQQRLTNLEPLIQNRLMEIQQSIQYFERNRQDQVTQSQITNQGIAVKQQIQAQLNTLKETEHQLLQTRTLATEESVANTIAIAAIGYLFSFALLIAVYYLLQRQIKQRKQAELRIYQHEQELESLVENIPDGIVRLDAQLRHLFVNSAVERDTGVPREAFIGKRPSEVNVPPEITAAVESACRKVINTQEIDFFELSVPSLTGQRFFQARVAPELSKTGQSNSVLCVFRDVTELKETQAALQAANEQLEARVQERTTELQLKIQELQRIEAVLRHSEHQYITLSQAVPVGILRTDHQGHCRYVNERWCEITGISFADAMNTGWLQGLHPQDREQVLQQWLEAVQERHGFAGEYRWLRSDGTIVWVLGQAAVELDDDGQVIGHVVTITDITARKQTEYALTHSEQRYLMLAEAVPVGIFRTDTSGNNFYHNQRWCQLTGLTIEQSKNQGWLSALHPDDRAHVFKCWHDFVHNNVPFQTEHRLVTTTGESIWVLAQALAEQDTHGTITGYVGTITDISDRKRTELLLQQARNSLELRVQERTQALLEANTQLQAEIQDRIEAQQQLEKLTTDLKRSNQELEQFAYVASHDLQEPLRAIAGYTQLLAQDYQDQFDESAQEYMGYVVDGAKRMQQLIQDLLSYSRVNTRGQPFRLVACQTIVEQVLKSLDFAIAECQGTVTVDSLPTLWGDPIQLSQLFQNLISNALKFQRSGETPQIHIWAEPENQQWRFGVRDNGIGIKSQYLERIFIIFKRLHTRREYPGTGIGLAICRKIVERHNGQIWAESEFGQGTTFYFTLPITPELDLKETNSPVDSTSS